MNLYHYYEKRRGPFLTLSDLPDALAEETQNLLKENDNVYFRRDHDGKYMFNRRIVERKLRLAFFEKGGNPRRQTPIYCILGESHDRNHASYKEWFSCPQYIEIPMNAIDVDAVSFTYGDSFIENHPEHRDQSKYLERVLTYNEILDRIEKQGWPQDIITDESPFWMPRYIEAQVWSDEVVNMNLSILK